MRSLGFFIVQSVKFIQGVGVKSFKVLSIRNFSFLK